MLFLACLCHVKRNEFWLLIGYIELCTAVATTEGVRSGGAMSSGDPEKEEPEMGKQENGEKKKEEKTESPRPQQFLDPLKVLAWGHDEGAGTAVNTYPVGRYSGDS